MIRQHLDVPAPRAGGPRERGGWVPACLVAFGAATLGAPRVAQAAPNFACMPPAVGVFGLDGPPDWTAAGVALHPIGKQLDDPRWNGSMRDDLPQFGGPTMPQAAFRAVQDGNKLYLTLQEIADPDGTTVGYDAIYLGFASATAASAKLMRFQLSADNVQDTTDFAPTAWHMPAGGAWASAPPPAFVVEPHVWAGTGTGTAGAAWALAVQIDLATLHADPDIGGAMGSNVRFFYAIDDTTHVSPPPATDVATVWPAGTSFAFTGCPGACVPAASMDPTAWGTAVVGTADPSCPTGIALIAEHIGTMPIDSSGIPSTTVQFGGPAGATNTFVAVMDNPPASAGAVKANFRLADWGSQIGDSSADWKSILPPGTPEPLNGTDPAHVERVLWTCDENPAASNHCPPLATGAPTDQCLLVELASAGGTTAVHFVQDSARRNLDFVHASRFTRDARISINGLAPLGGGGGRRDVYIYVKTTNMPEVVVPPPPGQDAGVAGDGGGTPDAGPVSDGGPVIGQPVGRPGGRTVPVGGRPLPPARGKGPPVYQPTVFESLRARWPTYEVHVYHTTGRTLDEGKGALELLEPQVAFGYLVEHAGTLAGWRHELRGRGVVLEEISPNFFHVKVPDNGAVVVNTTIHALEQAPPPPGTIHCACDVVRATRWSPLAVGLGALGVFALVWRARGRKRRD